MLGYHATLITAQGDGPALTASVTATSILPGQAKYTMPTNFIDTIGKTFRLKASGRITTVVTTPGTLTLAVRMGPTSTIVAAASQAFALNVVAKTNTTWWLDLELVVRSVGSGTAATIMANGVWESEAVVGSPLQSAGGIGALPWQTSAPVVGTGFDSTVANIVDLFATWSISNANSIQVHTYSLDSVN